jgi:predicted glycogen debranching enzyme
MSEIIREIPRFAAGAGEPAYDPSLEWLVTNGLGGYASGTVLGALTRRFHGLLISALPSPYGRTMMLNDLLDDVRFPGGRTVRLNATERTDTGFALNGAKYLTEFRLDDGLPVWRYDIEGTLIEKRVLLPHGQNTAIVRYRLERGGPIRLALRPAIHMRQHEGRVSRESESPYLLSVIEDRYELSIPGSHLPALRLLLRANDWAFTFRREKIENLLYRIEQRRGYDHVGDLWSPGYFHVEMNDADLVAMIASSERWEIIQALESEEAFAAEQSRRRQLIDMAGPAAGSGVAAELVFAADQFIIIPAGRVEDSVRARAAGDEMRTVVAGYHWFTDWGRDTMISLEGLTLATGRAIEARYILRTFAHYIRDGLIPNLFPEGENEGLYHTADATLWFFHALDRYVSTTSDKATLHLILPRLIEIIEHHMRGARFGIAMDPADGLLSQGAEGYQLTWMDAKVDGWVVTPRRGKAVEINALWYNALRLLESWVGGVESEATARVYAEWAERARLSFNERFWYEQGGYLYDVVDGERGDDSACRPNQVFAISLRHPVLDESRWKPVMQTVRERLLTPVGLRSLSPDHPDYKSKYYGDLRARDAAYHQGTVWAWLIGPFIDAWLKVYPEDRAGARKALEGMAPHLSEGCAGSISEIFDAEPPFMPRGCVAQAWSVAEMLRSWIKTEGAEGSVAGGL